MKPDGAVRLRLVPISIRAAQQFVQHHHRHHPPSQGALFALGCEASDQLVAVAIVGRPVGRGMQDGRTVEVVRLASDGTPNACSFLLGRARRAAAALGYTRVISYTMVAEGGASLRAAGFEQTALLPARDWGDNGRNANRHAAGERARWEATA